MKKLLSIIVLSLLLSFNANADDIKDFEIEGISLGDSLLEFIQKNTLKIKPKTMDTLIMILYL